MSESIKLEKYLDQIKKQSKIRIDLYIKGLKSRCKKEDIDDIPKVMYELLKHEMKGINRKTNNRLSEVIKNIKEFRKGTWKKSLKKD
jgi:hypothetical protein